MSKRASLAVHRDNTTSATRSMTLAYGGYAQDVVLNPRASMQQLQDTIVKRIATLDYLRRTHEGTVYWLNTLALTKSHLLTLPSFDTRKLARRAQNHLVLGLSLPAVLDPLQAPNANANAVDYLRALNDCLAEYETYHNLHNPDGHSSGSLGRTRLPAMFKRPVAVKKGRTASGTEALSPTSSLDHASGGGGSDNGGVRSFSMNSAASLSFSFAGSGFDSSYGDLHAGEEYTYLLTPSLPFEPDYFETFASLAEVLIDVYLVIKGFVETSAGTNEGAGGGGGGGGGVSPTVINLFGSADKRIRKVLVEGLVRDLGESVKGDVRGEVAGLGKLVLGALA